MCLRGFHMEILSAFKVLFNKEYGTQKIVLFALFVFLMVCLGSGRFAPAALAQSPNYEQMQSWINTIASILPILFSVYQCGKYWSQMKYDVEEKGKYGESVYPTMMVAQGTFFTFVGVAAILFSYDPSSNNPTAVIGGLKLAFVTSIIGMAFSIAAKSYLKNATEKYISQERQADENTPAYVDEEDFYRVAQSIDRTLKETLQAAIPAYNSIEAMQDYQKKQYDEMIKVFRHNMEELNQALLHQFEDLSHRMVESFASTFTGINTGLKQTNALLDHMNSSLDDTKNSTAEISDSFKSLTKSYREISCVMVNSSNTLQRMSDNLAYAQKTFVEATKAITAYGESLKKVDPAEALKNTNDKLFDLQEQIDVQIKIMEDTLENRNNELAKYMKDANSAVKETAKMMTSGMETYFKNANEQLADTRKEVDTILSKHDWDLAKCITVHKDEIGKIADSVSKQLKIYLDSISAKEDSADNMFKRSEDRINLKQQADEDSIGRAEKETLSEDGELEEYLASLRGKQDDDSEVLKNSSILPDAFKEDVPSKDGERK